MAFECPRRSSPPSPMFDADTGCIATDPAPSARRRFRSKTGIENLPANEHAQETPHTPSPTRTTRRIQSGCAGSRPRLRDGMPGSPSQHIDITRAKWIPYIAHYIDSVLIPLAEVFADIHSGCPSYKLRPAQKSGPFRVMPDSVCDPHTILLHGVLSDFRQGSVAPCDSSRSSRLVINWTSFNATSEASRWSAQNTRISVPDGIFRRDRESQIKNPSAQKML